MGQEQAGAGGGRGPWVALLLCVVILVAGATALVIAQRREPLARAWRAIQAATDYSVSGMTTTRWGADSRRLAIRGAGQTTGRLELGPAGEPRLTLAWPEVRAADGQALEPRAVAAILPLGDPLVLLATAHGAESGGMEWVAGRACRRVDFLVGGRAYQTWWQRHRSYLPFNADAGGMTTFSARGVVWLDPATDLPCRIQAQADMPRTPGELRGTAAVDWLYTWPVARH